jgi:hypothetical protein
MIKKRWLTLFDNIHPTDFILRHIDKATITDVLNQIDSYKKGFGDYGDSDAELNPSDLISIVFLLQPPIGQIHIIVKIPSP